MTSAAVSRFAVPALADMPDDIRTRILGVQEKSGFIPNVFLVLARRPDEFRAFFAYHDALMDKPGNLSKAEREMIVVATSAANQCHYCVIAHGAILRVRARNPSTSALLAAVAASGRPLPIGLPVTTMSGLKPVTSALPTSQGWISQ